MRKTKRIFSGFLAALTLTGCGILAGETVPTPYPDDYLPTVIALTAAAHATPTSQAVSGLESGLPLVESTPAPTSTPDLNAALTALPRLLASPTPTPTPARADIQILAPGPMSKVVSPLRLIAYVVPGHKDRVLVELFGEDGRLLRSESLTVFDPPYSDWGFLSLDLAFTIPTAAELGQIEISTRDEQGRYRSLAVVEVLLLSDGRHVLNPHGGRNERVQIFSPAPGATVAGDQLIVSGELWAFHDTPLIFELQDETGRILAVHELPGEQFTSYQPFSVVLFYRVNAETKALLTVRQNDTRFGKLAYLYSRNLILQP